MFRSSWVAAAELCDVSKPGDVMPVNVGGASLLLANDGGTVRAFHNVCRHRGAKLVEEPCSKRRTILCPYHRWGYALDGRLIATPSFDDTADGRRIPEHIRQKARSAKPHLPRSLARLSCGPACSGPTNAPPRRSVYTHTLICCSRSSAPRTSRTSTSRATASSP